MMGMNALFHLAAFLLISVLIYGLLVTLRQKRFLQALLHSATLKHHHRQVRVYVDEPCKFLTKFARAFGVAVHGEPAGRLDLRRIDPVPLVDLCLSHGLRSLAFGRADDGADRGCALQFEVLSMPSADLRAMLSSALGDGLVLRFNVVASSTHEETSC